MMYGRMGLFANCQDAFLDHFQEKGNGPKEGSENIHLRPSAPLYRMLYELIY